MAISNAMATSFKQEILQGYHNFGTVLSPYNGNTFKIALYTSSATLDASTTAYGVPSNEVANGNGYTTGGRELYLSVIPTTSGTTAYLSFSNTTWSSSTITAAGALIYNSTQSNRAVATLSFGGDKISTAGDFTINFPTAGASTAIIRIA